MADMQKTDILVKHAARLAFAWRKVKHQLVGPEDEILMDLHADLHTHWHEADSGGKRRPKA